MSKTIYTIEADDSSRYYYGYTTTLKKADVYRATHSIRKMRIIELKMLDNNYQDDTCLDSKINDKVSLNYLYEIQYILSKNMKSIIGINFPDDYMPYIGRKRKPYSQLEIKGRNTYLNVFVTTDNTNIKNAERIAKSLALEYIKTHSKLIKK